MQKFDTSFTTIKVQTSNDNLEDLIGNLRRFTEKNSEMSKKNFALENEIDLVQQKIDKERDDLVATMAKVAIVNDQHQLDSQTIQAQIQSVNRTTHQ